MKMCTSFSALLHKFNSTNCLAFSLHRKYCVNTVVTNNGIKSKNVHRKLNYVVNPLEEIMNTVPPESEALSPNDTLNIFRQLSETSRTLSSSSSAPTFSIIEHENFSILRQAMKVSMSYLKVTEKFDILKAIRTLSVPTDDDVYNSILSSFLDNFFNMSLNDIMVIDTFLVSQQMNPLARELHHSLIDRFNAKTSQLPVKFNYYIKLRRMLQFIERNRYKIIDESFVNIRNCANKREIDIFTANEAMETIIVLSNFGDKCEYFEPLLDKAFDVWSTNDVTIQMVETVLTFLTKRILMLDYSMYKDTRFIEKCARVAIESGNLDKCFTIQGQFNRLEFTSKQLIDILLENVGDVSVKERFIHNSISICIACDVANYRPPLFEDSLLPIMATTNFHQQLDIRLNWPKFALRLNSVGIYHKPLIQEILKRRQDFELFDEKSVQEIEVLHMEKLINAPVRNLLSDFKTTFGEHIRSLVHVDSGPVIPLLVKTDIHSKNFVPFGETETHSLSSIQCDDNQCLIAVVTSSTADVSSSRPSVITVPLTSSQWVKLLQNRAMDEFFSEISDHVQNQINKQEPTNIFQ